MPPTPRIAVLTSRTISRSTTTHVCISCQLRSYASKNDPNLPFTEKIRRKIWGTDNPPGAADPYGGPSFLEKRKMRREQEAAERRAERQLDEEEAERPQGRYRDPAATSRSADTGSSRRTLREQGRAIIEESKRKRSQDVSADELVEEDALADTAPQSRQRGVVSAEELEGVEIEEKEYKPAKTWDGLMHVGHRGNWEDMEPSAKDKYTRWIDTNLTTTHVLTPTTIEQTLDVLHQATLDAGSLVPRSELASTPLFFTDPQTLPILKAFHRLLATPLSSSAKLNTLSRTPNATWNDVAQLHINSVLAPPPKNLYESLAADERLIGQSNVMILPRRETPVDREKETGRWKVIERELRERGLPVLGRVEEQPREP